MAEQLHRFFHADRYRTLKTGQVLDVDARGLSPFGAQYIDALRTKSVGDMNAAERREAIAEQVRQERFSEKRFSRLQATYACLTVKDAISRATDIDPKPSHAIPIFELFTRDFHTLDQAWLDYATTPERALEYANAYWWGEITNHNPVSGPRQSPKLEVLVRLPCRIGEIVAYANPAASPAGEASCAERL